VADVLTLKKPPPRPAARSEGPRGTSPLYVEFPMDPVRDIHWKKKDDGSGVPIGGPPYCNTYSFGEYVGWSDIGQLFTGLPLPMAVAPFVCRWKTQEMNGPPDHPWGSLQLESYSPSLPDELTALPYGLIANSLLLSPNNIYFTNQQIMALPDYLGRFNTMTWNVPMAGGNAGTTEAPEFLFARSYTIEGEWSTDTFVSFGISATTGVPPATPDLIVGSASGRYRFTVDMMNGNRYVWWHWQHPGLDWRWESAFMETTLIAEGDHYSWTITANCE
jgi:hypothetical protein